MDALF
jgi:hypothetical protein